MSPAFFAWRSLSREPGRAALGILGVAIVGALLFDMLLLSRGLLLSFRDLLESTGYDVRVTATAGLPGTGPALRNPLPIVAQLRKLPELRDVRAVRIEPATLVAEKVQVNVLGSGPEPRTEGRVVRGRDLQGGGAREVVINEALARDAQVEPGGRIVLRPGKPTETTASPSTTFDVVGIAEFPFDVAGERTASVALDVFEHTLGGSAQEADMLLVASAPGAGPEAAVAAIRRARPDLHPFSIEELLQRFRHGDFSYFRQISGVLTLITSFFAFLLVATLLTVSVNQRLGEVAALRALGFSRRRVATDLVAECAAIVVTGSLLALPLGVLLARVLDGILRGMPGLPEKLHFFVLEPWAVALHLLLLGVSGVLAAVYPVVIAVRLPIAATLRREIAS